MTPEGKIKAKVNKVLARYPESYRFMPVPSGYGLSSLDYLVCHCGLFCAIETKAPGGKPTDRQKKIIAEIESAGGRTFVIDGDTAELEEWLENAYRSQRASETLETEQSRQAERVRAQATRGRRSPPRQSERRKQTLISKAPRKAEAA